MREPKIFSRKRRHGTTFYVEIDGQQINLGTDKADAQKEYHRLLSNRQEPSPRMPVVALIDRFLSDLDRTAKARRTYLWYKRHLDSFKAWLDPALSIDKLNGEVVNGWLLKRYAS